MAHILRGRKKPGEELTLRMAKVLGITPETLREALPKAPTGPDYQEEIAAMREELERTNRNLAALARRIEERMRLNKGDLLPDEPIEEGFSEGGRAGVPGGQAQEERRKPRS